MVEEPELWENWSFYLLRKWKGSLSWWCAKRNRKKCCPKPRFPESFPQSMESLRVGKNWNSMYLFISREGIRGLLGCLNVKSRKKAPAIVWVFVFSYKYILPFEHSFPRHPHCLCPRSLISQQAQSAALMGTSTALRCSLCAHPPPGASLALLQEPGGGPSRREHCSSWSCLQLIQPLRNPLVWDIQRFILTSPVCTGINPPSLHTKPPTQLGLTLCCPRKHGDQLPNAWTRALGG